MHAFRGHAIAPSTARALVEEAYDLSEIAARYTHFVRSWQTAETHSFGGDLEALTMVLSEWAQVVGADPRLPAADLPSDWPAVGAQQRLADLQESLVERIAQDGSGLRFLKLRTAH